jgi:amidase
VNSLAPSFDTVGIFAPDADVLARVALVLLACAPLSVSSPGKIHLINDTFALADAEVRTALSGPLRYLRDCFGERICQTSVHDLAADNAGSSFANWIDTFCVIQWAEIKSCLGTWIADARPEFGPNIAASFELTDQLDRRRVAEALQRRKQYAENLQRFLGPNDLLCIPTTPALAPLKGNPPARSSTGSGYYPRTLALTALAGIGRLPQVSLPMPQVGGVPVGLSLLASHGRDDFLLQAAKSLAEEAAVQLNCSDPPRL